MFATTSLSAIRFLTSNWDLNSNEGEQLFIKHFTSGHPNRNVLNVTQKEIANSFDDVMYQIEYN